MNAFLSRRVYIVTGKGGVGKTTVAVALGRALAQKARRRVLLCEIGDPEGGYSPLGRHFGKEFLTPEPEKFAPNISGCHLWSKKGHELFLRELLPAGPLIRAVLKSKALSKFLIAAPSFHEMGIFYHLLTLLDAKDRDGRPVYENIIVDMPATGHTLALTGLPEILLRLIPSGKIADEMHRGQNYLNNPKLGAALVVSLPEQLPVTETLELIQGLKDTSMFVSQIIVNKMPEDPFTDAEDAAIQKLASKTSFLGEFAWRSISSAKEEVERLKNATEIPLVLLPESPERGDALEKKLETSLTTLFSEEK